MCLNSVLLIICLLPFPYSGLNNFSYDQQLGSETSSLGHIEYLELSRSPRVFEWKISRRDNASFEVPPLGNGPGTSNCGVNYQRSFNNHSTGKSGYNICEAECKTYSVRVQRTPSLSLNVTRTSTGQSLLDTTAAPIVVSSRYAQLGTYLSSPWAYGIGEDSGPLLRQMGVNHTMWARGIYDTGQGKNLYGSHPFLLNLENTGHATGILLINSNAVKIELKQERDSERPSVIFRAQGGVLHFVLFVGESLKEVLQLYTERIGRPFFPPMWALGYQFSRWGFNSSGHVIEKSRQLKSTIPLDSIGLDIDVLDKKIPFTMSRQFDKTQLNTALKPTKVVVNLSWLLPAVRNHKAYRTARHKNLLLRDGVSGEILLGVNYPGVVAFPDFTAPHSQSWWTGLVREYFKSNIQFHGIFLDLNEPKLWIADRDCQEKYENVLNVNFGSYTICPSTLHTNGLEHYDLHNLYAWYQTQRTHHALKSIDPYKRWLIVSRGSFLGSGQWAGHWTGDISSTWAHLQHSIPHILTMGLVGMPFVGADICGYRHAADAELCVRWHEVGALYPMSRNHNRYTAPDQDPLSFTSQETIQIQRALRVRYQLILYLYTLFYTASVRDGLPVMRPLVLEFPLDPNVRDIDTQFMVGSGVMACPVLEKGVRNRKCYFPQGASWRDYHSLGKVHGEGIQRVVSAPLGTMPLFIRVGTIIPFHPNPGLLTTSDILTSEQVDLRVFISHRDPTAEGLLFSDDGETVLSSGRYTVTEFTFRNNNLYVKPLRHSSKFCKMIREVQIIGVDKGQDVGWVSVTGRGRLEEGLSWFHERQAEKVVVRPGQFGGLSTCTYYRITFHIEFVK